MPDASLAFDPASGPLGPDAGAPRLSYAGRELWLWAFLGVLALAIAGLAAPILALSRVPGVEDVFPWPVAAFEKGLVVHVVFSFVVWFLCLFGALAHLATLDTVGPGGALRHLGRLGLGLVAAAFPMLLVPAFLDRGEPSLNNYIPVIIDPLYYAGLGFLGLGVGCVALRLALEVGPRWRTADPIARAMGGAAVIALAALTAFACGLWGVWGRNPDFAFNEDLFWGGGHILQFLNATLLLVAWMRLGGMAFGVRPVRSQILGAGVLLLVIPAVLAPGLYAVTEPFSARQTQTFTDLQFALAPATLVVALALLPLIGRVLRDGLKGCDPARLALILSPAVFGVGGLLGLFVDGADTRTPAHYHGIIAGINLAFMALYLTLLLPMLGRAVPLGRMARAILWLFGLGQLAACIGLFVAGGYGAPRKAAGDAQGLTELGAQMGLYLNGIGALFAVIGGVLFVVIVGRALLRSPLTAAPKTPKS
ncbi:MAG: hypothetical protein ACPGNT_10100 [Rhodospirillales bacterium]